MESARVEGGRKLRLRRIALAIGFAIAGAPPLLRAQDLAPRAYIVTPVHWNAITLSDAFNDGDILLDGALPVTGGRGRGHVPALSLYHSLSLFGRSASVVASLPYGVMNFHGTLAGTEKSAYRSGLLDTVFRFSVNLKGAPAMPLGEYGKWRQKTLVGASLKVMAPTGQYDSTRLVNWGANRWAFRPELGVSHRLGHWIVDAYAGVWFYTTNQEYFSHNAVNAGVQTQSQAPIVAIETHLSYDVRPRLWISLDGNFWTGGTTSVNGVENPATSQRSSRVGASASFPLTRRQSLKASYARGAYVRFGGDFQVLSVAWQYSWIGGASMPSAARASGHSSSRQE